MAKLRKVETIVEFEIRDHGCDGEQYFPGCGTSFTRFSDVATGIGDSAREAADDALEQIASGGDLDSASIAVLEAAIAELSDETDTFTARDREAAEEAGEELNPEWHHYVSILYRKA